MARKLSVATRTGGMHQKRVNILECLKSFPEGATPKMISLGTSINVNTVKSILPCLDGVKKIMRGLYKVVERGDGGVLTDWNFHNLVMSVVVKVVPGSGVASSYDLGLVTARFMVSSRGHASLRVSCDTPLNVASIGVVFGFFVSLIKEWSDDVITGDKVFVKTVEFNKDYSNLRLDGLRCVTVESLTAQFKLYQKRLGLRVEHKTKVPLSVVNLVDLLRQNPASLDVNVKLVALRAQLDRQVLSAERNTQLLLKLIDKLNGGN